MIHVETKAPRRLATTTITNAHAEAIISLGQLFTTGAQPRRVDGWPLKSVPVQITGAVSGQVGRYDCKLIEPHAKPDASGAIAAADLGTLPADANCIAWDLAQVGSAGASRPLTGGVFAGVVFGVTDAGTPIVLIQSGVQRMRLKSDGTTLQAAYIVNPAGDSDWVDQVDVEPCDAGGGE